MRIIVLFFLLISSLKADDVLDNLARDTYMASINAAIVFTSQDGLSSGRYNFTNIDANMRMYNLPLQYQFDNLSEKTNIFMMFDLGYSDTRSDREVTVGEEFLHSENRLQTYVGGIGVGLRYRPTEHSDLLFGAEVLYSKVGVTASVEDGLTGSDVGNFFSDDFNENYSYKLLAEYVYHREIKGHKINVITNYKLYQTISKLDFSEVIEDAITDVFSLRSQTSVASIIFGYETDALYSYHDMSLTLEPFLKGNYIWGDLAEVGKINGFGTLGLSVYWNTPKKAAYIYRYFIEPSVSKGYGLEGVNLSLGFSMDF